MAAVVLRFAFDRALKLTAEIALERAAAELTLKLIPALLSAALVAVKLDNTDDEVGRLSATFPAKLVLIEDKFKPAAAAAALLTVIELVPALIAFIEFEVGDNVVVGTALAKRFLFKELVTVSDVELRFEECAEFDVDGT